LRRDCKIGRGIEKVFRNMRRRLLRSRLIGRGGPHRGSGIHCDLEYFACAFAVVVGYYRRMHFCETVILWTFREPSLSRGISTYPIPRSKKTRGVVPNPKHTCKVVCPGSEMGLVSKIIDAHMAPLDRVVLPNNNMRSHYTWTMRSYHWITGAQENKLSRNNVVFLIPSLTRSEFSYSTYACSCRESPSRKPVRIDILVR
jgi:hypothetical protein